MPFLIIEEDNSSETVCISYLPNPRYFPTQDTILSEISANLFQSLSLRYPADPRICDLVMHVATFQDVSYKHSGIIYYVPYPNYVIIPAQSPRFL